MPTYLSDNPLIDIDVPLRKRGNKIFQLEKIDPLRYLVRINGFLAEEYPVNYSQKLMFLFHTTAELAKHSELPIHGESIILTKAGEVILPRTLTPTADISWLKPLLNELLVEMKALETTE